MRRRAGRYPPLADLSKGFNRAWVGAQSICAITDRWTCFVLPGGCSKTLEISETNAGVVKTFTNSVRYYLEKNGEVQLVRLSKKEIILLLEERSGEVLDYVDSASLNWSKESHVGMIIQLFNSRQ